MELEKLREVRREKAERIVAHAMSSAINRGVSLNDLKAQPPSVDRNYDLLYLSNAVDELEALYSNALAAAESARQKAEEERPFYSDAEARREPRSPSPCTTPPEHPHLVSGPEDGASNGRHDLHAPDPVSAIQSAIGSPPMTSPTEARARLVQELGEKAALFRSTEPAVKFWGDVPRLLEEAAAALLPDPPATVEPIFVEAMRRQESSIIEDLTGIQRSLTKALTDLVEACELADAREELPEEIDGSLIDAAHAALTRSTVAVEPRCPDCGAQVDERFDCCKTLALTAEPTPATVEVDSTDWRAEYFNARDALWQFNNLPDPAILTKIADEIDCCPGCDCASYDHSTGITECSKEGSGECPNDDAGMLRSLASAIEVRAALRPTEASPAVTVEEIDWTKWEFDGAQYAEAQNMDGPMSRGHVHPQEYVRTIMAAGPPLYTLISEGR